MVPEFNETNWKETLGSLGFTESENHQFGGMVIWDDRRVPRWTYETEEEKRQLYVFLNGAVYWKVHTMFK